MPDEQAPIESLHFTHHTLMTLDTFPARTAFTESFLLTGFSYGVSAENDVVTVKVANGSASYQLRRDLPRYGRDGIVAELIDGSSDDALKQDADKIAKYETG